MKLSATVDDFGRVVLPKTVRSILGMERRTALKIEVIGDKIQLSVANAPRSEIKKKRGRPVYGGDLPVGWDSGEAVLRNRTNRLGLP
jgi:bifunctional DNA-binding transcriptional regulator/antitoxin component of YhaV-PrlF toxin-antitoxin module